MKRFLLILLSFIVVLVAYAELPVDKLKLVNSEYAVEFPKSKVFLKTDKDIYAPGEKIWFKAEIYNSLTERPAGEENLIVMIMNDEGEVVTDNTYLVNAGLVVDQVTVPSWATEQNAFLIAYTPNSLNVNQASLAAVKPITVNALEKNDYLMDVSIGDRIYKPGENISVKVFLQALTGSGQNEKIRISLFDYRKEVLSDKVSLKVGDAETFNYKLPGRVEDGLYLEVETCGRNKISQRIPIRTSADPITITFYPEGGDLLTNVVQRIVYRATDPFGKAVNVSGTVSDPQGNDVGVGKAMKNGYGLINLMPMPNQTYIFQLDSKYGKGQKYKMPKAVLDGTSLSMIKIEDDLLRLAINNTGAAVGKKQKVVAYKDGQVHLAYNLVAEQKNSLKIPTNELPEGIVNFAIFNEENNVISERLIYNTLHRDIDTEIETTVGEIDKNGEVEVTIDAGKFIEKYGDCWADIRVVDEQNLFEESSSNQSFLKYPLLTPTPQTVLDIYLTNLELIANQYRYYSLKDVLNGVDYLNNKDNESRLSGVVTDKSGSRIPNATVMVDHPNAPSLQSTKSDENGWFVFNNLSKSKEMMVKAISENGKKNYLVHLDRSFDESLEEIMLIESFKRKQQYSIDEMPGYYANNFDLLRKIGSETKSRRQVRVSTTQQMLQSGSSILDVVRMIKPFTLYGSMIVFSGSSNSFMSQQGALIVIDEIKMGTSIGAFNNVNPRDVVSINVSTDPADVQKYSGLNSVGVIEIRTKGSYAANNRKKKAEKRVTSFDTNNFSKSVWEYQTTLLWMPQQKIPSDGKITMKVKTSNIQSNFKVFVDAISIDGVKQKSRAEFSTIE